MKAIITLLLTFFICFLLSYLFDLATVERSLFRQIIVGTLIVFIFLIGLKVSFFLLKK